MKRITLLSLSVTVVASAAMGLRPSESLSAQFFASPLNRLKKSSLSMKSKNKEEKSHILTTRAEKAGALWKAKTQKAFGWTGEDWELGETYTMTYNGKGLVINSLCEDAEGALTRETNTWNENDQLASRIQEVAESAEDEFVVSSKLSREYDPILTSFITSNKQEMLVNGEWMDSNCYTQTITRNSEGNVTLMERAVLYNGVYDPTYRFEVEYNEAGQPITIIEKDLTFDYTTQTYQWEVTNSLTDIVWEEFDGQLVSLDEVFSGSTRVKTAKMLVDDIVADLVVTYEGDSYTATMTCVMEEEGIEINMKTSQNYAPLTFTGEESAHGKQGYRYEIVTELEFMGMTMAEDMIETGIYDENELIILEKVEYVEDDEVYLDEMISGEVEYDAEYGYPLSWTVSELDYDTEEMVNTFRAEYSDYADVSGVKEVISDDAPVRYYDLMGVPVANPTDGIYIRVQGAKSDKVRL